MSYAVLSAKTREHLEQERSRLINDREKIVALVSAEVDQTIQHLTALLEEAEAATIATAPAPELPDAVEIESLRTVRKTGKKATTPEAKAMSNQMSAFDAKQLKRNFKDISVSDAIVQTMQQNPSKIYAMDDLIAALYDKIDEADSSRVRKTLGAVLMHAVRAGKIDKVQDKPSRYKLGHETVSA